MRYLKIIVFVLMLMILVMPSEVRTQETAKEPATTAKKLSRDQLMKMVLFQSNFGLALQAQDTERIHKMIESDPETAKEVYQRLMQVGEGTGEQAEQARFLSWMLGSFLPGDLIGRPGEISQQQFVEEFSSAVQAQDAERIQQLIENNPNTAKQVQEMLTLAGEDTGEETERFRTLADILKKFLSGEVTETSEEMSLQQLYQEVVRAAFEERDAQRIRQLIKDHPDIARELQHQLTLASEDSEEETGGYELIAEILDIYLSSDSTEKAEEISSAEFFQKFQIALIINDADLVQQLIANNPKTTEELQQQLTRDGEGSGESAEQSRFFAEELRKFRLGYIPRPALEQLIDEASKAYYASDYPTALEKWQTGLQQARDLNDQYYISYFLGSIGTVFESFGQHQQALDYYQQALTIARDIGDTHWEGSVLGNISGVYNKIGQYQQALEYSKQALTIARDIGDKVGEAVGLTNVSGIYVNLGQYQQALDSSQQALIILHTLGNKLGEGKNFSRMGMTFANLGQYQQALEYSQQALEIHREIGDKRDESGDLTNIGIVHLELGQYQQALEYFQQALVIQRGLGDKYAEGGNLINIGNVYLQLGQYQQALDYCQQALAIHREIGNKQWEGYALGGIGLVYNTFGQYQQALEYFKQALAITRDIGDKRGEGSDLGSIGSVYKGLGQHQQALVYYEQSLAIHREIGNKTGEGITLNNIGLTYKELGQYQQAYSIFQNSIEIHETLGTLEGLWYAQGGLASVEVKLKQHDSAIIHYEQALDTIEALRAGLREKEQKLSFMQDKLYVYNELIDLLQDLHKQYPDKSYDRKALEIFERKQGRVFLEEMGQSGARLFTGIPDDILQRELDLELQLEQTHKHLVDERAKLITEQNKELIQNLEVRENTLKAEQETLQEQIKTNYPNYYALRYPKPAALADLQQNILQPGELLLVYGVMKEQTVLWIVSKQDFSLVPLGISEEELQQEIEAFRASPNAIIEAVNSGQQLKAIRLADDTLDDMAQAGYMLYQRLFPEAIRPLAAQARTLYIIPTGPLYGLPFETLVTETPEEDEAPHYLLQDHSITYLSSASLLKILRDAQARRKQTTKYPLLAFADPEYPETCQEEIPPNPPLQKGGVREQPLQKEEEFVQPLQAIRTKGYLKLMDKKTCFSKNDELPETKIEVEAIAKILDAPDDSVPLQLRERASRSNLFRFNEQERLDDYRYLLFSAHAILPGEVDHVNQPAIVLSHPETEGYLTMADAFALQLNAGLVALSACNTGRGEQVRGEGIMGLTRAFMYAGTPAVGVTLWSVDSKASSEINTRFFHHLKAGKNLANALRQAKLDLLAEVEEDSDLEHFRHPFFWAPFVVFGDASSK